MFNEFLGNYPSELSEKAIQEAREEREDDKTRMAKENFFGGYEEFVKVMENLFPLLGLFSGNQFEYQINYQQVLDKTGLKIDIQHQPLMINYN